MKLEFTTQESHTLVKMLSLASWMAELLAEAEPRHEFVHHAFEQVVQKAYRQAIEAGSSDIEQCGGEHGSDHEHLVLTEEAATFTEKILRDYTEHAFWEELEEGGQN